MLRRSESAVSCSNFRCRARLIKLSSPEPKQSRANATKAEINSGIPSPRLAEIPK